MKTILTLIPRTPLPLDSGNNLRNYNLLKGLARHFTVDTLFFSADPDTLPAKRGELRRFCREVRPFPLPSRYTPWKKVAGVLGRRPLPLLNYDSPAVRAFVESRFSSRSGPDVLFAESIHMVPYGVTAPPSVLRVWDWHNVESALMARYASAAPTAARRLYARLTSVKLARAERTLAPGCHAHLVCSEEDGRRVTAVAPGRPVETVPNGVDDELLQGWGGPGRGATMLFVGSMDYVANIDAVEQFVREILPRVRAALPDARLSIVGRTPGPRVLELGGHPAVTVTGSVPSIRPHYERARVSLCPFRVAGGTRLKVFEAMALGVPVVSTALGVEGIPCAHGENLHIADTPEAFAEGVIRLMRDDGYHRHLATAAHRFVSERYGWDRITDRLAALLDEMIEPPPSGLNR